MQGCILKDTIAQDKPVREAGLFGIHGGHVNCTDGRYVYGGKTYLYKYERANQDANLSKFGIKKVILVSQYGNKYNGSIRFLFDNFGNVFLSEGKRGDKNDINPFKNRNMLIKNAILYLCLNLTCDKNRSIVITPSGELITDLTQYISF
jgi:hypothetical protein